MDQAKQNCIIYNVQCMYKPSFLVKIRYFEYDGFNDNKTRCSYVP